MFLNLSNQWLNISNEKEKKLKNLIGLIAQVNHHRVEVAFKQFSKAVIFKASQDFHSFESRQISVDGTRHLNTFS